MNKIVLSLIIIIGSFLLGFIFEKFILRFLKEIAKKTKWEGDEIIIKSLEKWIIIWFTLIGIHITLFIIKIKPDVFNVLHKLLISIYILSITIVLINIASGFLKIYTEKLKEALPSVSILENIIKISILIIGLLVLLNFLGISIIPIITALGVGGIAIALALQDTLSNLFAGFHIILSKHIRPGDYVKLQTGEEGYVVDITWRNTTIKSLLNNLIVIPNSRLSSTIFTNYHLPEKEMSLIIPVTVSYDSDLERVEEVTTSIAKEVLREIYGKEDDEVFIRYSSFGEYGINFNVIINIKEFSQQYLIRHNFIKRLYKKYKEEGIVIPYPVRKIYIEEKEKFKE
ncbi:MAG: mechanosensitive ion channel domain-containing protein [candidate division WOR-3 bacterium]